MPLNNGLSSIWCEYFRYKNCRKENLLLMKPIAEINRGLDLILYNAQAKKLGLDLID